MLLCCVCTVAFEWLPMKVKLTDEHHERNIIIFCICQKNTAACSNFACMFMMINEKKSQNIKKKQKSGTLNK